MSLTFAAAAEGCEIEALEYDAEMDAYFTDVASHVFHGAPAEGIDKGSLVTLRFEYSGGAGTAGVIAAYNLTGTAQSFSFTAGDVPELDPAGSCWVWDFFARTARRLEGGGRWTGSLPAGGYGLYLLLPEGRRCTFLGRTDKYAGFLALETVQETKNTTIAVLYETGPVGWLAAQPPRRVAAGGLDLTGRLETAGPLCTLSLPEAPDRMVLEIDW